MTTQPSRTLADMTPEEREQCIGMWCDFDCPIHEDCPVHEDCVAIFIGMGENGSGFANLVHKGEPVFRVIPERLTPRFDLPRAWNPDGTPVAADPEEYTTDQIGYVYPQTFEEPGFPPGTKVRRWVSDWEAVE